MAHKYQQDVDVNLRTHLSDEGLQKLQIGLLRVARQADGLNLDKASQSAKALGAILQNSFDVTTGTISMAKFNAQLKNGLPDLIKMGQEISSVGPAGTKAFNDTLKSVLQVNTGMRQSNELLSKMATTMANTVRWGITSMVFQQITTSAQQAFYYVKDLDTALNDIRIVSGLSAASMEDFAVSANASAKALGASTKAYTEAALIYFQQGKGIEASKELARVTVMTSNVTRQSTKETSDELTGIWNGYQIATGEAEKYVDKMAAVAASTAADLQEMSTAINKTASSAKSSGVSFDQLNAMVATTVSVTKQAPEAVGTAYKTIFARLGDLAVNGSSKVDGFTVKLGTIAKQLDKAGISILDANGNMRDMGTVISEVGDRWQSFDRGQKQAIATTIGGKRQWNYVMALFENWNMYTEQLNVSQQSLGTLQQQNGIYLESAAGKMQQLQAATEGLYSALIDIEDVKTATDSLTSFVEVITSFVKGSGGGLNLLLMGITALVGLFRVQLSGAVVNGISRFQDFFKSNERGLASLLVGTKKQAAAYKEMWDSMSATAQKQGVSGLSEADRTNFGAKLGGNQGAVNLLATARSYSPLIKYMTPDQEAQYQEVLDLQQKAGEALSAPAMAEKAKERAANAAAEAAAAEKAASRFKKTNSEGAVAARVKAEALNQVAVAEEKAAMAATENAEASAADADALVQSANAADARLKSSVKLTAGLQTTMQVASGIGTLAFALNGLTDSLATGENLFQSLIFVIPAFIALIMQVGAALVQAGILAHAAFPELLVIGAVIAAISGIAVAIGAENKKREEAIKLAKENYDTSKDELSGLKELQSQYNSALKSFQDNGTEKQKLIELSGQLADKYNDESIRLAGLAGDYTTVTRKMEEHRKALLAQNAAAANASLEGLKSEKDLPSSPAQRLPGLEQRLQGLTETYGMSPEAAAETPNLPGADQILQVQQAIKDIKNSTDILGGAFEYQNKIQEAQKQITNLENQPITPENQDKLKKLNDDVLEYSKILGVLAPYQEKVSASAAGLIDNIYGENVAVEDTTSSMEAFAQQMEVTTEGWVSAEEAAMKYALALVDSGKLSKEDAAYELAYAAALGDRKLALEDLAAILNAPPFKDNKPLFTGTERFIQNTGQKTSKDTLTSEANLQGGKAVAALTTAQEKLNKAQANNKNGKNAKDIEIYKKEVTKLTNNLNDLYIKQRLAAAGFDLTDSAVNGLSRGIKKLSDANWSTAKQKKSKDALVSYFNEIGNAALAAAAAQLYAINLARAKSNVAASMHNMPAEDRAAAMANIDPTAILNQTVDQLKAQTDQLNNGTGSGAGTSKKKKKGGGGGGSPKDTLKHISAEIDIYHDLDKILSTITADYEALKAAQDELTGKALTDNLKEQVSLLERQQKLQERRLALEKLQLASMRASLTKSSVKFNTDGSISNYTAILKKAEKAVNDAVDKYNKHKTDKNKTAVDNAKTSLDNLKTRIEKYDTLLYDTIANTKKEIDSLEDSIVEAQVQQFTIVVSTNLDLDSAKRSWEDFISKITSSTNEETSLSLTKITNNFNDLTSFFNNGTGSIDTLTQALRGVNVEIDKMNQGQRSSIFGDDMKKATDKRKELFDQLKNELLSYYDTINSIKDAEIAWANEATTSFDKINKQYDYINNSLKHQANLMKLLYGDDATNQMQDYYNAQVNNNLNNLNLLKSQVSILQAAQSALGSRENSPEVWDAYTEKIQAAQSSLNTLVETSLQNMLDKYKNEVTNIISAFTKSLTGGLTLTEVSEEWDFVNKQADMYLDTTTETYNMRKLEARYADEIANTTSETAQHKINALMQEQLKYLREKNRLTQFDLDRANKLLDIKLKEIALEDAQNAKSKMALQRNAQGNYGFTYVADKEAITKAKQELDDARQAQYEADKKNFKDTQSNFLSLWKEFQDKLAAAPAGESQNIIDKYSAVFNNLSQNLATAKEDLIATVGEQLKGTSEYDVFMQDPETYLSSIGATVDSGLTTMANNIINNGGLSSLGSTLMASLTGAATDYKNSVASVSQNAGESFDNITSSINATNDATNNLALAGIALVTTMGDQIGKLGEMVTQLAAVKAGMDSAAASALTLAKVVYGSSYDISKLGIPNINDLLGIKGFDTGGYTGAFGSEGKLALLHEKEIVLNKEDTSNLLATVSAVREIAGNIKSGVMASMAGLTAGLNVNSFASINPSANADKIEQTVKIEANFPNVTSSIEIEKALKNLPNTATQYVHKVQTQ